MSRIAEIRSKLTIIPQDPPKRIVGTSRPTITLAFSAYGNKRHVSISRAAFAAIGSPNHIQVAVAGRHLAIRACQPSEEGARKLAKDHTVRATELADIFGLKIGERFRFDAELDEGYLLCTVSDDLLRRAEARKQRSGQAA